MTVLQKGASRQEKAYLPVSPDDPDLVEMIKAGLALHWLRRRGKLPADTGWSEAPVNTIESLKATYRKGANIGVRLGQPSETGHGFVHVLDIDIRDPALAEDAWQVVRRLLPEVDRLPMVVSGSGGESRNVYFVTERPFRSGKLAVSQTFKTVYDKQKGRDVKKRGWEVELFGTGKQVVLPPSIHPDTGKQYTWLRQFQVIVLQFGIGPHVAASRVSTWGALSEPAADEPEDDDDDLFALIARGPLGLW